LNKALKAAKLNDMQSGLLDFIIRVQQ